MVLKCKMCFDVLKWPCLDGAPLWWGGHFSLPTHLATRPLLSKVLKLDHCCQKYWDLFTIVKIIETLPLLINLICCITVALVVVLHQIGLERSPGWLLIWDRVVGDMGRLYSISHIYHILHILHILAGSRGHNWPFRCLDSAYSAYFAYFTYFAYSAYFAYPSLSDSFCHLFFQKQITL